jgi:hypothetical protein
VGRRQYAKGIRGDKNCQLLFANRNYVLLTYWRFKKLQKDTFPPFYLESLLLEFTFMRGKTNSKKMDDGPANILS